MCLCRETIDPTVFVKTVLASLLFVAVLCRNQCLHVWVSSAPGFNFAILYICSVVSCFIFMRQSHDVALADL